MPIGVEIMNINNPKSPVKKDHYCKPYKDPCTEFRVVKFLKYMVGIVPYPDCGEVRKQGSQEDSGKKEQYYLKTK